MKTQIVKISSGVAIGICFCIFTAMTIEDKMKIQVDYVPVQKITEREVDIPAACLRSFQNGRQGIFYVGESEGVWGTEYVIFEEDILEEKIHGSVMTTETSKRMIVGYSSQELKEGMKVKKVEP